MDTNVLLFFFTEKYGWDNALFALEERALSLMVMLLFYILYQIIVIFVEKEKRRYIHFLSSTR